jgi:hypothetical protein
MKHSNKASATVPKGRPFVKGDPRINRNHGPICADAAAYSMNAKNALAKKLPPSEWAELIAKFARRGAPWALQICRDVLVEQTTQKHEVTACLTFSFGENGNGHDK